MRLIDADELCEGRVCNDPVVIAAKCAPTIEAEPVRHGKWEKVEEESTPLDTVWKCNNDKCGCKVGAYGIFTPYGLGYIYCPKCGTKMDGGADHAGEGS